MMDVENRTISPSEDHMDDSKLESDDEDECVEIIPVTPSNNKSPCAPLNGHSVSPATPSTASKKRKRLSLQEREERDRERAEKKAKLEEERQKKEEEKQRREEERLQKLALKEEERRKKEEERLQREEERKKKQEEAERLRKQKEEEKRLKEEERKKKQEEEEKRKKEKEEEKRQKEEEKRKKLEEEERKKKEKEEERLKKLEEKEKEKKKEEEKLAKQAKIFSSFFQKSPSSNTKTTPKRITPILVGDSARKDASPSVTSSQEERNPNAFCPMMFEVKRDMALAPICRRKLSDADVSTFDQLVLRKSGPNDMELDDDVPKTQKLGKGYLKLLKKKGGRKSGRTEMSADGGDVEIIAHPVIENPKEQGLVKWRYKLLQFHENQRPAYWGTWKRIPNIVKGRKPFAHEKEIDYDFDSDDEWEEEPEDAEDLADSDKEEDAPDKDADSEDDEDGWLVPHGYISDDEGSQDEHLDKETMKISEKDYFEGLKKQIKVHLPEIQTTKLTDFRIIFSPLRKKWKETCAKAAAAAKPSIPDIVELP